MTSDSSRRWSPAAHAKYLETKAGEAEQRKERGTGAAIARDLDRIWRDLSDDELGLMEFLFTNDAPTSFVAAYDEPLLKSLVERGLLQCPQGVGGNWMRALRTSFRVTPAVRDKIRANADAYFGNDPELRRRSRSKAETFLRSKAVF